MANQVGTMIESVAVRQRGAFDFETHYENLCALQSSCPLTAVKAHLSESVLDINGDRIRATDWVPILNTIRINKTLTFIAVRSYYQQVIEEHEAKAHMKRKTPAVRSKEITYRLCRGLKECLAVTPTLSCIELQGLPIRERDLSSLAKGLMHNSTLQHLSLEYSIIGDEGLDIICNGVKNSASITSLNFTGCSLSWKGCETLAQVIKHQAMKRHNEAWQDSLRYRRPDLDRMPGIRRITINANPMISDQGAVQLAEALKDDLWLKALDLQQCGVSDVGAKALLDVLKYNTTIVVLDLRQNPMINQDVIRTIMEHVMINSNGQDTEYKWIKATPPQDPSKAKARKKKTKTLQSSFGKKTTIRVSQSGNGNGRRRTKSAGAVSRSLLPFNAESVKPGPGMPWRTAMRADRYRGYPPEHSPQKDELYEKSPTSSPTRETSIHVDYSIASDSTSDNTDSARAHGHGVDFSESDFSVPANFKQFKIELEQSRRRLKEEVAARARAEERALELTVENRRLRQEFEDIMARGSLLDDDRVLESIEASFQQFHCFLDLLRDAGLGQLITLAGLDKAMMPTFARSASGGISMNNGGASGRPSGSMLSAQSKPVPDHTGGEHPDSSPENESASHPASTGIKMVMPHLVPDNYAESQDPTMQQSSAQDDSLPHNKTKFDELFQRALQETEGALTQAKSDSHRVKVNGHASAGPAGDSIGDDSKMDFDKSDHSHHSQRSQHSQASSRSQQSQHSQKSNASQSNRSQKGPTSSFHSISKSLREGSQTKAASPGKDYSLSFEKSPSEISEVIEELDSFPLKDESEEDDF